jgi:hypothetical protein
MAHFAELDENNIVIRVIVVDNTKIIDEAGIEQELLGINFLKSIFGETTRWVQTSYNGNFRKNYAGAGYFYNQDLDAFIPPKPFDDWILNTDSCQWEDPNSDNTDTITEI